jgi:hypothetical protein
MEWFECAGLQVEYIVGQITFRGPTLTKLGMAMVATGYYYWNGRGGEHFFFANPLVLERTPEPESKGRS